MFGEYEDYDYWVYLPFLYMPLSITDDGKYWILQQLFIKVEEANPEMSTEGIMKIVMEKIKKRDSDFFDLQCRAFFGRYN